MIHGMVWKLEDNPIDTPFYIRRDYDEHCIQPFFDADDMGGFYQFIYWDLHKLARFYVDEVFESAPFQFLLPGEPESHKDLEGTFKKESPDGPIQCELYIHSWDWFIAACTIVKVKNG